MLFEFMNSNAVIFSHFNIPYTQNNCECQEFFIFSYLFESRLHFKIPFWMMTYLCKHLYIHVGKQRLLHVCLPSKSTLGLSQQSHSWNLTCTRGLFSIWEQ